MSRFNADELREQIEEIEAEKARLENNENTDEYDEMLDSEGDVTVAGLTFSPSAIVKEMDPTAYSCGMNDYNDSRLTEIEDELESLKNDLSEAEAEEAEAKS